MASFLDVLFSQHKSGYNFSCCRVLDQSFCFVYNHFKKFLEKKIFFLKNKEKYEIIQYIFCSMNIGGSIRLNPCGLLTLGLFALFLMYYSFGWATNKNSHAESISIKSLLAASIDVAKRGGLEVKRIREQVSNILFF